MIEIAQSDFEFPAPHDAEAVTAWAAYLRRMMMLITFLSALVVHAPASATILYSGGEDVDFICATGGSCSSSTDSQSFRAGWARLSLIVNATSSDPPLNRFVTPTFSPAPTIWIHAQYCTSFYNCNNGDYSSLVGRQMLRVIDNSGNPTLLLRGSGTNGQLIISSRTSAGVFTDLVTCPSAFTPALTQLDLYVNYGVAGEVALYTNSIKICDFTGNVTNGDGASSLDGLELAAPGNYTGSWSEVIVATTDTRAMSRFTANTAGNGNTVGFTGTNICSSIWKANQYSNASFGYTASNNVVHECTINNAIPPGAYSVAALTMSARALVGSSGPQHFDFVVRTNGTDYTSPDFAPIISFTNISNYIQATNPATGSAWTISDLNAASFNIGLESKP